MKPKKPESQAQCPRVNAEAETVAAWAYRSLLQDNREPFPYNGVTVRSTPDGDGVELTPIEKPKLTARRSKPFGDHETLIRICKLMPKLKRVLDQFEQVLDRGNFSMEPSSLAFASEMGQAIGRFNELLLRFAELPKNPHPADAVKHIAIRSLFAAVELEKLSRRNLEIVRPIARLSGAFPVAYSPHKDRKSELEKLAENLTIGSSAPENVWNQRVSFAGNQSDVGIYAIRAMQSVLRPIHVSPLRSRLLSEVRGVMLRSMDTFPLTKQERRLLIARGWPAWILDTVDLPTITHETSRLWAKAGWAALKEAAGGDVTSIPELAAKGESNAQYARRRATTEKGKKGRQASRKETQIKKLFIKAFVARFGSQPVTLLEA